MVLGGRFFGLTFYHNRTKVNNSLNAHHINKVDDRPVESLDHGLEDFWPEALEDGPHNIHQSNGLDGCSHTTQALTSLGKRIPLDGI